MKAWKVRTGYEKDFYGYTTNTEINKYFFNKEDAEKLYNEGIYYEEETHTTTIYNNGYVSKSVTGINFYEREVKDAQYTKERKENIKDIIVEKVKVPYNKYTIEEIEIN